MPPSYGSQEYWDQRFTSEPNPFEWLEAPHALDTFLLDALNMSEETYPKILHVGCGTSMLSHHLRTIVQEPDQIHNLDYSQIAIDLGRKREKEIRNKDKRTSKDSSDKYMSWDVADLLDYKSLTSVCKPNSYSVIIDKSTSDSIACCDDVDVSLPYLVDVHLDGPVDLNLPEPYEYLHPLYVMAVHLALVTKPRSRWITLSYSNERYPFLDEAHSSHQHIPGFPDPGKLWKLIEKREVETLHQNPTSETKDGKVTHRPKVFNWVYILERTEVPLFVRGAHL